MAKASVLTIRVPADLKRRIEVAAEEQGVSINQLAMYMFAREVSSLEAGKQMAGYWSGFSKEDVLAGFDKTMAKVRRRKVPAWDAT